MSEAAPPLPAGPFVRLLQCFECKTMEQMPDYPPAADPNRDVVLHTIDLRHGGDTEQPHYRALHRFAQRDWDNRAKRREIVEQMWKDTSGFLPSYYDIRDTLKDDAQKCFVAHHRHIPCLDYRDSSKRLSNPAAADRRAAAKEFHNDALKESHVRVWLCDFCPIQVTVELAQRRAAGLE